jgi:NAD(P)-dependent dehydrogenase (short-subunit alcohol dehydrogenase family)
MTSAEAVVEEIRQAGGSAIVDETDVSTPTSGESIVDTALRKWARVDAVVNNAGIIRGRGGIEENSDDDFLANFQVHTMGSVRLARAAWPHMKKAGHGRIVNTSSDSLFGYPGSTTYVTFKAANFGLTRSLAIEGEPYGIKVNTVAPLGVTRMSASGDEDHAHYLDPARAAPLVVSLLHRQSSVTGIMFQSAGNRAAEIFLGVTAGYTAQPEDPLDEIASHLVDVMDRTQWYSPRNFQDSLDFTLTQLKRAEQERRGM